MTNQNIKYNSIGVFDSGVGGITVLAEISKLLPNESVIYVGDVTNCPYGEKSIEEIRGYCENIGDWLISQHVKLIVIACNTATAAAYKLMESKYNVEVVGVVGAAVNAAVECTINKNVGILATRATVESCIYKNQLQKKDSTINVFQQAAPKLVEYVETDYNMVLNNPTEEVMQSIRDYCKIFKDHDCDTVIMGCTHFPYFNDLLQKELGNNVHLVSPSKKTAETIKDILEDQNLFNDKEGSYEFYTTGADLEKFRTFWDGPGSFSRIKL